MASTELLASFLEGLTLTGSALRAYLRQRFKECQLDLTTEMMQVLWYLWGHDGVNQQGIANAIGRDKASLTSLIDSLARRELVERQADSQDRRNNRIVLTAKGQALEQQVRPLVQQLYEVASHALPEDQLRTSLAVLEQLTHNLAQAKT